MLNIIFLSSITFNIIFIFFWYFKERFIISLSKLFFINFSIISACFFSIVLCFILDNFSLEITAFNSSSLLPLIYKISSIWVTYEGSLLLFLLAISLISWIFFSNKVLSEVSYTGISQLIILLILEGFVLLCANPFKVIGIDLIEGFGMNPLLQDKAVSIHPPMLYFGYALTSIIFSTSIGYLINKEKLLNIVNYSRICWIFLTLGVGLGSWWAYRELGWGGFWFFDPVENLSLIPWFIITAYHHSLIIYIKQSKLLRWTISLGMLSFICVIFSLFLIRSGLIVSVHSFAYDPSIRNYILLSILILLIIYSVTLYIKNLTKLTTITPAKSSNIAIIFLNITALIIIFVLWIASVYPIIYYNVTSLAITLDKQFFLSTLIPLVIVFIIGMAFLSYKTIIKSKFLLYTLVIIMCLMMFIPNIPKILLLSAIASLMLIINTCIHFLFKTHFLKAKLTSSSMSMIIAHLSLGILALAIALNTYLSKEVNITVNVGDTIKNEIFTATLKNLKYAKKQNYVRQIAEVQIEHSNTTTILKPEIRFYQIEDQLTSNMDIQSFILYDIAAVINNVRDNVNMTIYYRPMMSLLWLSLISMCLGIGIHFFRK